MATIWVRADGSGDDGNNGSTYPLAKATYTAALAAANSGDTINIVNDGQHVMVNSVPAAQIVDKVGTSWDDPGLVIRGCDPSGNAAFADVVSSSEIGGGSNGFIAWSSSSYVHIKGIRFLLYVGDNSPYNPIEVSQTKHVRITDCEFWGTDGVGPEATGPFAASIDGNAGWTIATATKIDIHGCVFVNVRGNFLGGDYVEYDVSHNVFITDKESTETNLQIATTWNYIPEDNVIHKFYNNTCVVIIRGSGGAAGPCVSSSSCPNTNNMAHYNNLFFVDIPDGHTSGTVIYSGHTAATTGTPIRLGYDLFCVYTSAWTSGVSHGYGNYQFNQDFCDGEAWDSRDLHPNSIEANGTAFADMFYDVTVEYDWTPYEYTHTLPYDLRPLIGRTSGYDGAVIGAIDDAINPIIDPGAGDDPLLRVYIDAAPFFRPTLDVSTQIRIKTKRNRNKHHDLANYTLRETWNESTHRVINLATSTTTEITLGGVETAKYLFVDTDNPIDVSINDSSRYWPAAGAIAVALSEISTVYLRNNSTTNTAQVFVAVVD